MSYVNQVLAVGLVGIVLAAGPARRASAGPQAATSEAAKVDDSTLKSRIIANLKKNTTIAARDLEVEVNAGIVTLKGVVGTGAEKARAARLATIKGTTEVRNEIVVDAAAVKEKAGKAIDATTQAGEKTADVAKGAAQTTGEKTKELAGSAAKKTKEGVAAAGEAITDGRITARVKTRFFDEALLKGSDVHVETSGHVVTLKGTVASSAAKARAEALAGGTEGVTGVVNELVVKGT